MRVSEFAGRKRAQILEDVASARESSPGSFRTNSCARGSAHWARQ